MKKIGILVFILSLALVSSALAATPQNAELLSSTGTIHLSSGSSIAEAVATPDDGDFVQMGVGSTITLKFPGDYVAVPDGTSATDLRVDIYDALYQADAEVLVSLNGTTWTSLGVKSDTANIDLDLEGTGPVKYVKIDQGSNFIDPAYPDLGFDLDAVVALNAVEDKCPGTTTDTTLLSQGTNRWIWDGSKWKTVLPKGTGPTFTPTMDYTYGCSCTQILNNMKNTTGLDFGGHYKYGCSKSILEDWHNGTYLLETVTIPAIQETDTLSNTVLKTGYDYVITAKGTASAIEDNSILFDAEYSSTSGENPWVDGVTGYEGFGLNLLDLMVNGGFIDWGAYNPLHIYTHTVSGANAPLGLRVWDVYYPNNLGNLTADIAVKLWQVSKR